VAEKDDLAKEAAESLRQAANGYSRLAEKQKKLWERTTQRAVSQGLAVLSAGLAVAVATSTGVFFKQTQRAQVNDYFSAERPEARAAMERAIAEIKERMDKVTAPVPGKPENARLADIEARLDAVTKKQAELESYIMATPEKALAVPLLRRDLDAQKDSAAQSAASLKANIDQLYDITKWLLGTMAVSVLGLAFSTFFRNYQVKAGPDEK